MPRALVLAVLAALALPVVACGGAEEPEGVPPFGSGLDVKALAGPVCPVETIPPDPACAPRPIAFAFVVVDAAGAEVARGETGASGETRLVATPPGTFTIRAASEGGPPTLKPVEVTVLEGAVTPITLDVDTGIR